MAFERRRGRLPGRGAAGRGRARGRARRAGRGLRGACRSGARCRWRCVAGCRSCRSRASRCSRRRSTGRSERPGDRHANALVFLVLVASYSVGAHAPLRRSLPALVGAAAWLAALEAIGGDGQDYAFLAAAAGRAVALGPRRTEVPAPGRPAARTRDTAGARARGERARRRRARAPADGARDPRCDRARCRRDGPSGVRRRGDARARPRACPEGAGRGAAHRPGGRE